MAIACLINDDHSYHSIAAALHPAGLGCTRFSINDSLSRGHSPAAYEAVLFDADGEVQTTRRASRWSAVATALNAPLILLSSDRAGVTEALEAGADDFIAKPFTPLELIARVRAVLRRHRRSPSQPKRVELADFVLERDSQRLLDQGKPVELTSREFALAWMLFCSAGACLPRRTISIAIWGVEEDIAAHTLEQHVYSLRRKLKLSSKRGLTLRAVYARGYCLTPAGSEEERPTQPAATAEQ